MFEIINFNQKIVIGFSDLVDDLENRIFKKLSEQEFLNTTFEVINITSFEIKEMLVSGNTIVCKINVTAKCNNPSVGKIITLDNFEIRNNSIIFTSGRIQIITKIPSLKNIKTHYNVKIEAVKLVSKNILCVATIVD